MVAYLQFLHEEWSHDCNIVNMTKLKEVVQVNTNHGFVNPTQTPVHFTIQYKNRYNLEELQGRSYGVIS